MNGAAVVEAENDGRRNNNRIKGIKFDSKTGLCLFTHSSLPIGFDISISVRKAEML